MKYPTSLFSLMVFVVSGEKWTEYLSQDGKFVYVTCDCTGLEFYFSIWEQPWKENMASLELKNCYKLILNTSKIVDLDVDNLKSFRQLSIINVTELIILKNDYSSCLPSNLLIKNVDFIRKFRIPRYDEQCEKFDLTLKSLVLKNVTINAFISDKNLSQLEMDEVNINIAKSNSLKQINKIGVVKISNSVIQIADSGFMNFNVSEVIFSGNEIRNFNESDRLFSFHADKVILNGNLIKTLTKETMEIVSDDVKITQNTIVRMNENAFDSIRSKSPDSSFEFSNNVVDFLFVNPLRREDSEIEIFSNLTITGNIIDFCCEKNLSFGSFNWGKIFRNFYSKGTSETNYYKCWKFPSRYLQHDVLRRNYNFDLCKSHCACLIEDIDSALKVIAAQSKLKSYDMNSGENVENDSYSANENKLDNVAFSFCDGIKLGGNINHLNFIIFSFAVILAFIG